MLVGEEIERVDFLVGCLHAVGEGGERNLDEAY